MIDPKVIEAQYKRMSNEELIRFAKVESQFLTIDAFSLLKSEFELRDLDMAFIDDAETDKMLSEINKVSNFENETAKEYAKMIWQFAFDEKEKGKSDLEIFHSLLKKGVEENAAHMLIISMEEKSKKLSDNFGTDIIVGWVFFVIGVIILFLLMQGFLKDWLFLYGLSTGIIFSVGGIIRLNISYRKKKKFETISKNIEDEKNRNNNLYQ